MTTEYCKPDEKQPVEDSAEEKDIEETDSEEEEDDYFDDENSSIIRAKWIFDGARTLDEVIECLKQEIEHIKKLKEDGWELIREVNDDYGFIKKKPN